MCYTQYPIYPDKHLDQAVTVYYLVQYRASHILTPLNPQ